MLKDRLKQLRFSRNITQADVAEAIGVTATTIGNYEQGTRFPRYATVQKLAYYFDVSVDYLMDKTDLPTPSFTDDDPMFQFLEYQTERPIFYNGIDITSLIFPNPNEKTSHNKDQIFAFTEFMGRSGHILYARRNLMYILNRLKDMSRENIVNSLDETANKIDERIVHWYKRCWTNIDSIFPTVNSLESLLDILNICINLDTVATEEFSLVPLSRDYSWLRDKLL